MLFEKATEMKLRWNIRGMVSVEDLWDLPVEELNAAYQALNRQVKAKKEDTLLGSRATAADRVLTIKIEIIKYIVGVKLEREEASKTRAEKKAKKQKLLAIRAKREEAELEDKSLEEIDAMIDAL